MTKILKESIKSELHDMQDIKDQLNVCCFEIILFTSMIYYYLSNKYTYYKLINNLSYAIRIFVGM